MLIDPETDLDRDVEQDTCTQGPVVGIFRTKVAIVDRGTNAEREEDVRRQLVLPTHIGVGLAGAPGRVNGDADGGSQGAAKETPERRKECLQVDIERGLLDVVPEE